MSDFFTNWLGREAMRHPAVVLSIIILVSVGGGLAINPFVMASDFQSFQEKTDGRLTKLEGAVCTVQFSIEKSGLEAQIRAVGSEAYSLDRLIQQGDGTSRDVERLDNLKLEQARLERELAELVRRNSCGLGRE